MWLAVWFGCPIATTFDCVGAATLSGELGVRACADRWLD